MDTAGYAQEIVGELQRSAAELDAGGVEQFAELLQRSGKIFVAGAGRSGLMGRAFAMRLMHAGRAAYVVGETVTPGIEAGDVLVLGSGSGETKGLVAMAEKAKAIGASVALVTIAPESTLGRLADYTVQLPGATKEASGERATIQPMASLFEQTLLVFYDAVILRLMEWTGQTTTQMFGKHANLE
ncbi:MULTISPECIES: 6-phospho-3-hexuloisomerase [unclassified Paenibacillus]|uniref:6-phospho-3-hexuloisomerase n=1 Tax=unclassified Paenibacillus TaxID=185978 RepID=UPI00240515C7|nr:MULTISPECIES: 6-phospho-3-hexuloisomerase [unclassified Paenibacillus]MDF9839933.1 6-phospho-3-hexuloisomerase [Paenibacillus sp. PastF-2]MDF9846515.1 6-phospho-3-hexuloisomerase [Paenibacillus sp. PastM-2]MDF9853137.1 6-phospho-3-hexuloisomerase [Paenibacillus sp. PastF-1]MDH6478359.1 6-phospho-3-hexuloisomerase [Paenibacillus sp. PastH-2]MDH6506143.1 6-phospho-3-hexuloisomerase [Paenibacillus sp. PastM-3]